MALEVAISTIRTFHIDNVQVNPTSRTADTTDLQASYRERQERNLPPIHTPLIVKAGPDDSYWLIGGHRRLTAAKAVGLTTVPIELLDETEESLLRLLEDNLHQEYTPLERAKLAAQLEGRGHSTRQARIVLGVNSSMYALLGDLLAAPASVQQAIHAGRMSLSAFRAMAKESYERQQEVMDRAENAKQTSDGRITATVVRTARDDLRAEETGAPVVPGVEDLPKQFRAHMAGVSQILNRALSEDEHTRLTGLAETWGQQLLDWAKEGYSGHRIRIS